MVETTTDPAGSRSARPHWSFAFVALALIVGAAACGSSSGSAKATTTAASSSSGGVVVNLADVPGLGKVLVDSKGDTLYVLSSEKGNKVTCTDANTCTKYWPDSELPKGTTSATAGPGVNAALLGVAKGPTGDSYASYATYPLYTYAADGGPGQSHGEGIPGFGGVWHAINAAGQAVMSSTGSTTTTSGY